MDLKQSVQVFFSVKGERSTKQKINSHQRNIATTRITTAVADYMYQ